MESACPLCYGLVVHGRLHPKLTKISAIEQSVLYKCNCCEAYLHHFEGSWEIMSGGHYEAPAVQAQTSVELVKTTAA